MTLAQNITSGGSPDPIAYSRIERHASSPEMRWIGRCKRCKRTHKIEGKLQRGHRERHPSTSDYVIETAGGAIYTCAGMGTDPGTVWVRCDDHHALLKRVFEGTKKSKHECGARCTNATGPNCDCRCKGKNHGSGC